MTAFKQNHKGRKRFTLLELLIVVAIIAILAAMLLPALNKAREAGLASNCRGNLRQQALALQQYTGDNNDFYPVTWAVDKASGANKPDPYQAPPKTNLYLGITQPAVEKYFNPSFPNAVIKPITPYNGSKVFYCPARQNILAAAQHSDYGGWISGWIPKFYELKISHLKRPTISLFRVDTWYKLNSLFGRLDMNDLKWNQVHFRHSNRANTVFFDGHVSSIPVSIKSKIFTDFAQIE